MSQNPSITSGSTIASSTFALTGSPPTSSSSSSSGDLPNKIRKSVGRLSENIHILANDPSLALFCLQEHIRKEVPNIIKQRTDFSNQHRLLQGTCYDIDYSIGAMKSTEKSVAEFDSIQNHLRNALSLKQQLKFEEVRKRKQQQQLQHR